MGIVVERFQVSNDELAKKAFAIREKVFVEEQEVSREEEYDQYEGDSIHFLALYNDKPVGTARWRETDKGVKLERFAVLKEFRGKGVGEAVLSKVLKDVIPIGKEIYLHAQVSALGFYLKAGFEKEGDMFSEANIDHYRMVYKNDH